MTPYPKIPYQPLSSEEARRKIEGLLPGNTFLQIIDVRTQEEFRLHYLPGSRLIPLAELEKRSPQLDVEQETLVVSERGSRSQIACELLEGKGFRRLYNLEGGIQNYSGLVLGRRALERSIAG